MPRIRGLIFWMQLLSDLPEIFNAERLAPKAEDFFSSRVIWRFRQLPTRNAYVKSPQKSAKNCSLCRTDLRMTYAQYYAHPVHGRPNIG